MTPTEELRAMLDERGVEWRGRRYNVESVTTIWRALGTKVHYRENRFGQTRLHADAVTPEQAIAATLGIEDSYTHRDVERAFVGGYCLGADMFNQSKEDKGWDERLREMDEEMAERGWVRKDATLGAGTCKDICAGVSEFTCSKCGFNCDLTSWISLFDGDEGKHRHHHHGTPNYCPNCGRRVMEVDE